MNDEEDLDPCDTCQVDEEVRAPITCFETIFRPSGADDALEADVERLSNNPLDSQSDGTIAANSWAPFDPAGGNAAIPFNVDFELDSNQRILDYGSLTLTIEGCRQDEMDVNFSIEIQLENQFGPSQVIPIQGPQFAASNMVLILSFLATFDSRSASLCFSSTSMGLPSRDLASICCENSR